MPQHWIRGPSGAPRIMACPGCVAEQLKWPEEPSGGAAIDGTHSHTLLEQSILNQQWDASKWLGQTLKDHDGEFLVKQDRCDRVQIALDYVQSRLAIPGMGLYCEHTVDAGRRHGIPEWKGTSDLIFHNPTAGVIEITDYKDGYKIVDPLGAQNISYASGAIDSWPLANFHKISLGIIQPKNTANPVNVVDVTRAEFDDKLLPPVVAAMQASMNPNARRVPGDHCKYCRGAHPGRCVEFNAKVTGAINDAFSTLPKPGDVMSQFNQPVPSDETGAVTRAQVNQAVAQVHAQPQAAPWFMDTELPLDKLTVTQLETVMDFAPMVVARLEEIKAEALKRSRNGIKFVNYKRVATAGAVGWEPSLEDGDLQKKLRNTGLKRPDFLKETVRTPKQILALPAVKGTGDFKDKGWSEQKLKNFERLIERKANGDKLVHESQPGKELDDSELFANLPKPEEVKAEFNKPSVAPDFSEPVPFGPFPNFGKRPSGLSPGVVGPAGSNAPVQLIEQEVEDDDSFM